MIKRRAFTTSPLFAPRCAVISTQRSAKTNVLTREPVMGAEDFAGMA